MCCFLFFQGFIIIKDFFKPEELNPVRDAIDGLVEDLAQKLYKAGKIKGSDIYMYIYTKTSC